MKTIGYLVAAVFCCLLSALTVAGLVAIFTFSGVDFMNVAFAILIVGVNFTVWYTFKQSTKK